MGKAQLLNMTECVQYRYNSALVRLREVQVPSEISARFAGACGLQSQNGVMGVSNMFPDFPLKDGLEAFFYHFNGFSQPMDSMSYLRLKSIWIMDRIKESNEWKRLQQANPGGLYDRCVREMDRRLRDGCTRVNSSQISLPELLLQLPQDIFNICPPATSNNIATSVNHLGVLLDIPILPDPNTHTLHIVRNIYSTLGIEKTTVTTTE